MAGRQEGGGGETDGTFYSTVFGVSCVIDVMYYIRYYFRVILCINIGMYRTVHVC